jgi:hypothetical protein
VNPKKSMASNRANLAILALMIAWLAHRTNRVGLAMAIAEALGLGDFYERYQNAYRPLHREIFGPLDWSDVLDTSLTSALTLNATRRIDALQFLVTDHGHGVFSLPFLRPEVAARLASEVSHFRRSENHVSAAPTSMHEYGVVLGADGLDGLQGLESTLLRALALVSGALYGPNSSASSSTHSEVPSSALLSVHPVERCCSRHHAFVVNYNSSEQAELDMHHDASSVTLNVCLSQDAARVDKPAEDHGESQPEEDGALRFCGFVGTEAHRRRTVTLRHAVGRAVIHLGGHRHGVARLAAGNTRQNLILWARSRDELQAAAQLHPRELPPDSECLSWTHDADYEEQSLPPAAIRSREKRRLSAELLELAARATDEHIDQLPPGHQDVVRMLRHAALGQGMGVRGAEQADRIPGGHVVVEHPDNRPRPPTAEIVD